MGTSIKFPLFEGESWTNKAPAGFTEVPGARIRLASSGPTPEYATVLGFIANGGRTSLVAVEVDQSSWPPSRRCRAGVFGTLTPQRYLVRRFPRDTP